MRFKLIISIVPKITKKDILKKRTSFSRNRSGPGGFSGRATGIPVAGAIGGGDDYKQKIGRNKRPYYQGDTGTPSQSADSGFSSFLSRVNRGFEEIETVMFPDQEVDEIQLDDDIYDIDHLMRKKTMQSKKSPNMLKHEKKQYSLSILFEQSDLITGEISDFIGDTARALVGGADGLDWLILIPSLGFNLMQISSETDEGKEALKEARAAWRNYETDLQNEALEKEFLKKLDRLESVSRDIATDLVDILQIMVALAPGSLATSAMSLAPNLANLGKFGKYVKSFFPGSGKVPPAAAEKVFKKGFENVGKDADKAAKGIRGVFSKEGRRNVGTKFFNQFVYNTFVQELGPLIDDLADRLPSGVKGALNPLTDGIDMLGSLEESIMMYNDRIESIAQHGFVTKDLEVLPAGEEEEKEKEIKVQPVRPEEPAATVARAPGELTVGDIYAAMLGEGPVKKEKALREFIREEILKEYVAHQPDSMHPPKPNGYQFHKPLYIENEEGDVIEDEIKTFDDYAAVFAADDGVVAYSPRPKNVNEVRSMIRDILEEKDSKKKRKIETKHL